MKVGNYELQVPFVTTSADHVKVVLELSRLQPGARIVDLGSGDGRMVLAFAKAANNRPTILVTGYEIKEHLVVKSRQRIIQSGLQDIASIYHESFWETDLSQFSIVYLYGMQSILGRLEAKLEKELQPGTYVISNIFRFPHWRVKQTKDNVHLYIKQE